MNICTKILPVIFAGLSVLAACNHHSLEDQAAKEAKEFTERYCPTTVNSMQRIDSVGFDRTTHTFSYHYSLIGDADNIEAVNKMRSKVRKALIDDLVGNTANKIYKEEGYNYHYVFRSAKSGKVLFDEKLTRTDYQ